MTNNTDPAGLSPSLQQWAVIADRGKGDDMDAEPPSIADMVPGIGPEPDVCYNCHGAGHFDGGDMRDNEPCHACNSTGMAVPPPSVQDMAVGTTFTADFVFGNRGCRFERGDGDAPIRLVPARTSYWIDDIDPSTIRDVTPPGATQ